MADEIDMEVDSIASFPSGEPDNYGRAESKKKEKKEKDETPFSTAEFEAVADFNKKESEGRDYTAKERQAGLAGVKSYYADTPETIAKRKKYEKEMVESGAWSGDNVLDATFKKVEHGVKNVPLNPVDIATGAKGYASESKLKWEASKYGVTPTEFERMKNLPGGLVKIKEVVDIGKNRESGLKHAQTLDEKTKAETAALRAQAAQRFAKAEQIENPQVPQGGRRLVQFGSTDFGQTPLYMNARGSHSQMRSQFIPGQASGVSNSLASSRLEIAKMKQRVLAGPNEGGVNAVQLLQPRANVVGLPSTVSRLAASSPRANPVSKLSMTGYRPGPSILDKLSANRRKP